MPQPQSGARLIANQIERLRGLPRKMRIVFPEGDDSRVQRAAARLARQQLLEPILVAGKPALAGAGVRFVDPCACDSTLMYTAMLYERRRAKGITEAAAAQAAGHPLNFAALMVSAGDADAMVGSCVYTTAEFTRTVLQCIGLRAGFTRLSSVHFVAVRNRACGCDGIVAFADAAIQVDPSAAELAEIAVSTSESVLGVLGVEPLVALLSLSTKGSAQHPRVKKVVDAYERARSIAPDLKVDGELQADAALSSFVGQKKCPGSPVAGYANTLIFPDLDSANIAYKLVERLGGAALMAVLLQDLCQPAAIISRGCTVDDAYHTALITAVQASSFQPSLAVSGNA